MVKGEYYQLHKEEIKRKSREYYLKNKERHNLGSKVYAEKNREAIREYKKRHYIKTKRQHISNIRMRVYGISLEEFESLFHQQGGKCGICLSQLTLGKGAHLDHDHVSGKIRAVLCSTCNTGLGQFKDNPVLLQAAVAYLVNHKGNM